MADQEPPVVDETFTDTLDWEVAEAPLPDHAEGSAFLAGYYVGMLDGFLVQDRDHDNLARTHTFTVSAMHLGRIEMVAAKYGYRMVVLDPGREGIKLARVQFSRERPPSPAMNGGWVNPDIYGDRAPRAQALLDHG